MRTPRNGDRVMYHPTPLDKLSENGAPLAAIISHVWTSTCVSLMVIDAHGNPHGRSSIYLHQQGVKPNTGFCEWPAKEQYAD